MSAAPATAFEDIFDLQRFKVRSGYDDIANAIAHLQQHCARLDLAHTAPEGSRVWLYGRMIRRFKPGAGRLEFLMDDSENPDRYIRCIDYSGRLEPVYRDIFKTPYFEEVEPPVAVCGTLLRNGVNGSAILSRRPASDLMLDLAVLSPDEEQEKNQVLYLFYPGDYLTKLLVR